MAAATLALTAPGPALADGPAVFANTAALVIPASGSANQTGPASPYPSPIPVSGLTGPVTVVTVTLNGLTHAALNDVDALVVAPTGENLVVLSDLGDPNQLTTAASIDLTFDDAAVGPVPAQLNVPSGTFQPTNGAGADVFPAPAPAPSALTTLSGAFTGIDPNGIWNLFIVDDNTGDVGSLDGGWSITVTTDASTAPTTTVATTSGTPTTTGDPVTFTATVAAGGNPVAVGSVQFSDGASNLGAPVTVGADGTASLTTSALSEGAHEIRAVYSGAAGFLSSNAVISQRVDNATVVTGTTFCNPGVISIPALGAAGPYPSHIAVAGLTGQVTKVTATLDGLSHLAPFDLDVMLSGPASGNVLLLSDGGGFTPVSDLTVSFDDDAVGPVPVPLVSGTFQPTNSDDGSADAFPAPAPVPSGSTSLADFVGHSANGQWSLWVLDDASADSGSINGGWCVTFVVAPAPTADAGGPYSVAEGGSLTFDGSGSTSVGVYEWDVNGNADYTDATGIAPVLTWADLEALGIDDGPAAITVALRVTVGAVVVTDTADLQITNTAPVATVTGTGAATATVDTPFTLKVGADDPSAADMAADFVYTVDWDDGSPVETVTGPADPPVTHTYTAAGTFSASFTATDKDGGASAPRTVRVVVSAASAGPTPTPTPIPTPTLPSPPPSGSGSLPPTGADSSGPTALALLFLTAGLFLLGASRARRLRSR